MNSGEKLDELVATHVLGWRKEGNGWRAPTSESILALRPFSKDLTSAWEIVDRVCDEGFRLQLDGSRIWQARFYKSAAHTLETQAFSVTGKTPALAICLAALAVKGVARPA